MFVLPRWRRRTREAAATRARSPLPAGAPLDAADARRLQEDLASFD
jgi:hypothetical protein